MTYGYAPSWGAACEIIANKLTTLPRFEGVPPEQLLATVRKNAEIIHDLRTLKIEGFSSVNSTNP